MSPHENYILSPSCECGHAESNHIIKTEYRQYPEEDKSTYDKCMKCSCKMYIHLLTPKSNPFADPSI